MHLSDERYEEIKTKAVDMLDHIHLKGYPLDATSLITALGGMVIPYSSLPDRKKQKFEQMLSKDGFQLIYNGKLYVFYNDSMGVGRSRYTLLHEAGHFWLGHSHSSELAESEADFFAKYCLAPPVLVQYFRCGNYLELMSQFQLSEEAARYAWKFYQRWFARAEERLSDQELRLCGLLGIQTDGRKHREVIDME